MGKTTTKVFEYTFTVKHDFQIKLDEEGVDIIQQALDATLREAALVQKACLLEAMVTATKDELYDKKGQ